MERFFKVYCQHCLQYHSTEEVEFLNVEEDIQGRDIMHFGCPFTTLEENGTSSLVYTGGFVVKIQQK